MQTKNNVASIKQNNAKEKNLTIDDNTVYMFPIFHMSRETTEKWIDWDDNERENILRCLSVAYDFAGETGFCLFNEERTIQYALATKNSDNNFLWEYKIYSEQEIQETAEKITSLPYLGETSAEPINFVPDVPVENIQGKTDLLIRDYILNKIKSNKETRYIELGKFEQFWEDKNEMIRLDAQKQIAEIMLSAYFSNNIEPPMVLINANNEAVYIAAYHKEAQYLSNCELTGNDRKILFREIMQSQNTNNS